MVRNILFPHNRVATRNVTHVGRRGHVPEHLVLKHFDGETVSNKNLDITVFHDFVLVRFFDATVFGFWAVSFELWMGVGEVWRQNFENIVVMEF